MEKTEMNNEIILLRHAVRQARVCIINKNLKEAKLLRNKHGDKAQLEKYKRKADRLVAEVRALKAIQDDDITKFGISNERSLTEILQDQSSSNRDRIIARVVFYKTLYRRLMQFKEKFPDCNKYLAERKKKVTKLKNKSAAKIKKPLTETNPQLWDKSLKKQKVNSDENIKNSQDDSKDEEACNTESLEARNNSRKRKKSLNKDSPPLEKRKSLRLEKNSTLEDIVIDGQSDVITPHNVTKEAMVKRFTELLEEQESNKDVQTSVESPNSTSLTIEQAKTTDDFFFTGDGRNYYENSINPSTSTRSQEQCTRVKVFQTGDRKTKKQNTKYKNDTKFNKKYLDEQSSTMKSKKMASNNIDKSANKNNSNKVNDKEENDLHPSWLAKKKQQEIMSKGFQGKRIVFTDD